MCDVFCSESIECFPGTVSRFFLKLLVTIPVAPIIAGTIVHFRFHIRCISIHKLLLLLLLLLLTFRGYQRQKQGLSFFPLSRFNQYDGALVIRLCPTTDACGICIML